MQAAHDFQQALQARLSADPVLTALLGGPKIHDHAPEGAALPYVTWGNVSAFDWSTASDEGREVITSLHVWTRARGKKDVYAIMAALRTAVLSAPVSLAEGQVVMLGIDSEEARYGPPGMHHGILRLRTLIETSA